MDCDSRIPAHNGVAANCSAKACLAATEWYDEKHLLPRCPSSTWVCGVIVCRRDYLGNGSREATTSLRRTLARCHHALSLASIGATADVPQSAHNLVDHISRARGMVNREPYGCMLSYTAPTEALSHFHPGQPAKGGWSANKERRISRRDEADAFLPARIPGWARKGVEDSLRGHSGRLLFPVPRFPRFVRDDHSPLE